MTSVREIKSVTRGYLNEHKRSLEALLNAVIEVNDLALSVSLDGAKVIRVLQDERKRALATADDDSVTLSPDVRAAVDWMVDLPDSGRDGALEDDPDEWFDEVADANERLIGKLRARIAEADDLLSKIR